MEARRGDSGHWSVAEPCLRPGGLTFSSPFILLEGHSADTDLDLKACLWHSGEGAGEIE